MYKWCESFPNDIINISILGVPGSGKTFLLECICSKLIERGFNVVFCTAFDFNEECRKYSKKLEEETNIVLNEAKQVGTLYHSTTIASLEDIFMLYYK